MEPHITTHALAAVRSKRLGFSLNALAISFALILGLLPDAAHAQSTVSAQVNIAAQSLNSALLQLGQQTDIQIYYLPETVANLRAPAVSGTLTAEQALARLLRGTNIDVRWKGNTVSLSAPAATTELEPVVVTGSRDLPPAYAGGQVARAGRLGMLGNKDVMDTPFSQTSYTNKTIQDQQAQTIQDVLSNDPSIVTKQNSASDEDGSINIRGFPTTFASGAGSLNGLTGMAPLRAPDMDYIERVEVLKGPNALLNGMAASGASGPGGSYNLVTKQADDEPLTELTTRYDSRSQLGAHLDVGRRFGAENRFGIRFNGAYRKGDTPVDPISAEVGSAAINLDYRGERVRISADVAHQSNDANPQVIQQLAVTNLGFVPQAPDAGTSLNPAWSKQHSRLTLGMVQGEVDVTDNITAYAAIGKQKLDFFLIGPSQPTLRDTSGTYGWNSAEYSRYAYDVLSMQGGLRAKATTGPVDHALSLNLSQSRMETGSAETQIPYTGTTNLYNPVFGSAPFLADPGDPSTSSKSRVSSTAIADTLSILDERIQFTAGIRYQEVQGTNFDMATGAETSNYDSDAWTPALGLIVKPRENVSLYANYIENLQRGAIVGPSYSNSGEVFSPYVSKQYETGVKVDWGTVTTTLAAFQIAQPNTISIDGPAGGLPALALDGEVRNRGIELSAYGEITPGVRLMGGVTLLDSRQTKTKDGLYDGHREAGAPAVRAVLGGEWDTPFMQGLTLTGRIIYSGDQVVSSNNEHLKLPAWTTVDLGARYVLDSPWNKQPVTLRFNVDNVFGKNYWSGTNNRYIQLGSPRTFRLSATFAF
ncbi:TonB-dependent receptor [Pollutimonas sp. M17]|uniref:TonB-dependent receptor n=1 Tax=Pollutimonas sp. M17 TaxID=2962065 RepID=UPI0021F4E2EA|nr:TonB-dependent receptor [Pollutimonas sp. M17]UYO95025.1 TonB-dependent receptor [Pollutimonas sp. M17]